MKKMLINATQPEELRIALVEGNRLYDLVLDNAALERQRNNIYRGVVKSVEPSLGAVFVEYGSQRHGFMPLRAISHESFSKPPADPQNVKIEEAIRAGDALLVQVEKDERDTKGAALTTFIKLTGHHITLTPNDPRAGRLPKQMSDAEHRAALDAIKQLGIPDGMGYIVRSPDIVERPDDLRRDLERLLGTWKSIQAAYQEHRSPQLLYKEEGSVMCALRDYVVRDDIDEVWIDDIAVFKNATEYAGRAMPEKVDKIKLYEDTVPLFSYYQIERQIETAFQHEVPLPAGGRLVIDHTEALVSVDVNSARSTSASDIEQTALDTNLEAGAAVALQLRLRDIGGLIVIDFIDMKSKAHGAKVEETLRRALSKDHANIQVGHLSRFGLLEMSRQRIRPSLLETSSQVCSRCGGRGTVRRVRSVALTVFRIIHETAQKEQTSEIRVQVSPEVAAWAVERKARRDQCDRAAQQPAFVDFAKSWLGIVTVRDIAVAGARQRGARCRRQLRCAQGQCGRGRRAATQGAQRRIRPAQPAAASGGAWRIDGNKGVDQRLAAQGGATRGVGIPGLVLRLARLLYARRTRARQAA